MAELQSLEVIANYWASLPEAQKVESKNFAFAFTPTKAESITKMFNSLWYRYCLAYQPTSALKQITIPVLALSGELDWITPVEDLTIIAQALEQAGNKDYTTIKLPKLNHSFQTCKTGALSEYAAIEETISSAALNALSEWILKRTLQK